MEAKWIHGLTPQMPIERAAKKILASRLKAVRHWLPLVAHAEKDSEFVHQLRVTTRRAAAALKLFRECVDSREYRRIKKLLRELRQSAGEARDWDVFHERFYAADSEPTGERLKLYLFGFEISQRMLAQEELSRVAEKLRQPLDAICDNLEDSIEEPSKETPSNFGELAIEELQILFYDLEIATHPLPEAYEALHQIRILGKKLRYVMELCVDCFTPRLRESLLPKIEEMQKILGHANDAQVTVERMNDIGEFTEKFRPTDWPLISEELATLVRGEELVLGKKRQQFLDWLNSWDEATREIELRAELLG